MCRSALPYYVYSANGKLDDELVLFELREIKTGLELERTVAGSSSWLAFVKTPGNRRRLAVIVMIGIATQFAGNGVVQYYIGECLLDQRVVSLPPPGRPGCCLRFWAFLAGRWIS